MKQVIETMMQNLDNKILVLDQIIEVDARQKHILEDSKPDLKEYDSVFKEKAILLQQLQKLDNEFEKLYSSISEELQLNKHKYSNEIEEIRQRIKKITEQGDIIKSLEINNKAVFTSRVDGMKSAAKSFRTNAKAVNQYNQNMQNFNIIDPQFMDNKN